MTVTRGTTNRNERGSSTQRRELKLWILATFGDGISCPCSFCGRALLYSEVTKDRYPIPGRKGGRYVRGNVRPACMSCNATEGAREAAAERREKAEQRERRLARRRELYAQRRATLSGDLRPWEPGTGTGALAS